MELTSELALETNPELQINAKKLLDLKESDLAELLKHYKVSTSMVRESMESVRQWFERQAHLPQGALDNNKLFRHLAVRGFSIERTKEKIDHYFNARNVLPELTADRDPTSLALDRVFDTVQIVVLPQKTKENYRVTIYRFLNDDPHACAVWDVFKLAFMIADYRLENDFSLGEHFVIDMRKLKLGHVLQVTPTIISKVNYYAYTCVGAKVKGLHLVGLPHYAEAMMGMFKKTIPKKISERIYTYPDFDDLKKEFPQHILPEDMGGDEMSSEKIYGLWKESLQSTAWRTWFLEQESVRTDETKRDKTSSTSAAVEELLGMQGSFRKLDLD